MTLVPHRMMSSPRTFLSMKQSRARGDVVEQAVGRAKRLASPALVAARVEAMVLENEFALRRRQQTDRRDETVAVKRGCFRGGRHAPPHRLAQAIAKGSACIDRGAVSRQLVDLTSEAFSDFCRA